MVFKGGKLRMEAFQKLKVFLMNPGRFCLLVLGSRGTGKRFAIEHAFNELFDKHTGEELCLKKLNFVESRDLPDVPEKLDKFLALYDLQTLVIEDVENLSSEQEILLFKALSTIDGTFGIAKKVKVRVVFTSSIESELLRNDGTYFSGLFWDRISQLIVQFPSYKNEPDNIVADFKETWKKMKFEKLDEYACYSGLPKNASLEKFLEDNAGKFEGGFRDLDKLACMYFNYRIYFYKQVKKIDENTEKIIVEQVKNDFWGMSQMLSNSLNDESTFQITPGLSMVDLIRSFKIQVRKWAVKEYGTVINAEKQLKLGRGTMKNYVKRKATKSQKG